ncbi:Hypothetical protein PMT_2357 [Prochlorococcus marinus str. MIT 9313]|uniref:Uncharacterized protein n=1 Tax=Prochlorococcus marinus (strain MIT 9313) TaxID=74547 RepID=B9ERN3_PROMM|nr:Hypothetical protein PMT_2357 [Prochlorococcus marinus str. MIT 9313]
MANANWSRDIPDGPIWESALELGYQFMLGSNVSIQPGAIHLQSDGQG